MKTLVIKTLFVILCIGIINNTKASTGVKVPAQVAAAYAKAYPQAKLRDWKLEKSGYKAEFSLNHKKYTVVYTADGTLVRTETQLNSTNEVPIAVKNALRKGKYASFYIDSIKQVNKGDQFNYIMTLDNHGGSTMASEGYGSWEDYLVVYAGNGDLMRVTEL
jgi:hypothetical protein